ncbi:MAG: hypothetical protein JXB14_01895 [Candidatus Altiarchaeota archaeon]|nr:hypothetical protein [Candidatus Altiarchaeota archaeon]
MDARIEPVIVVIAVSVVITCGQVLGGSGGDIIIEPGDIHPQLDGNSRSYPEEWDIATVLVDKGQTKAKIMPVSVFLYILAWADDGTRHDQDFIEVCFDEGDNAEHYFDSDDVCLRVYRNGTRYESVRNEGVGAQNDWGVAIRESGGTRWYVEFRVEYEKLGLRIGREKSMGLMLRYWDKDGDEIVPVWPAGIDYEKPNQWGSISSSNKWKLHPSLIFKPELANAVVEPASGRYPTEFNFSASYVDMDGDKPLGVSIIFIDQPQKTMMQKTEECGPKTGCPYEYKATLDPGTYRFYFTAQNRQHTIKTGEYILEVLPEKDYIPQLRNPVLEPFVGNRRTAHEFGFEYYDEGGQHPESARMVIEDHGDVMMRRRPGCRPEQGCWYYYDELFPPGFYAYYYRIDDGYYFVTSNKSWFRIEGFESPPNLTNGSVTPLEGGADTKFFYSVNYRDLDGDYAEFVVVSIDGDEYSMMTVPGCEPSLGCLFTTTRRLKNGSHEHFFEASDGNQTVRFPENGTFTGPMVIIPGEAAGEKAGEGEEDEQNGGWSLDIDENTRNIMLVVVVCVVVYMIRASLIKRRKKKKKLFGGQKKRIDEKHS